MLINGLAMLYRPASLYLSELRSPSPPPTDLRRLVSVAEFPAPIVDKLCPEQEPDACVILVLK